MTLGTTLIPDFYNIEINL